MNRMNENDLPIDQLKRDYSLPPHLEQAREAAWHRLQVTLKNREQRKKTLGPALKMPVHWLKRLLSRIIPI